MTRSSRLMAVGAVVLLAGIVAAVLALGGQGAAADTAGAVPPLAAPTDEVPTEVPFEELDRLPLPLEVPEGHEAVAVTVVFDRAVANVPVPGDVVNVYGVMADTSDASDAETSVAVPGIARIGSGLEVLGVAGAPVDGATGTVTLVLAAEPDEAATVLYASSSEQVWFSLVGEDDEAADVGDLFTREDLLDLVG